MSQVNKSQRLGIINAAIHIIESDLQIQAAEPEQQRNITPAIMIAFNALEPDDQLLIANRMMQVLKEQQVKLTQK